jgi:putative glycosyltransferase (TIGR04372 family)
MKIVKDIVIFPFSLLFLLLVFALRYFYIIRWQPLISTRLGHFAGNTELYCCERDHGINVPNKPYLDLFYLILPVCNQQLAKMWAREINIVPKIASPIFIRSTRMIIFFKNSLPFFCDHLIGDNANSDRDIYNLLDRTKQHLFFTKKEKNKGEKWLNDNNVPKNASIVLLMVRDNAYLSNFQGDFDYHNYRDCSIDNFVSTAEKLANKGFCVIRMGHHTSKLNSKHPLIIDYATNGMRNDFMDIYLASICYFIVSTGHGAEAPAAWCFRKPRVIVNQCPTGRLQTYSCKDLLLTKHHILQKESRRLTLSEIFSNGVGMCMSSQCYIENEVEVLENTPEEICDITMEMVERLDGSWKSEVEDIELQNKFLKVFPSNLADKNGNLLHGEIKAHFGARFLRDNPDWLE